MGVQPYVNTGATYEGYCGKYINLVAGNGWNDYVVDHLRACTGAADPRRSSLSASASRRATARTVTAASTR